MADEVARTMVCQAAVEKWELQNPDRVKEYKRPSEPDLLAKKKGRHAAVKKWERKNPDRVQMYKRTSMLRRAEHLDQVPNIKTLLRHNVSPEQILSLVQKFTERHAATSA